ncbi:DNA-binding response regulator [Paractinoplanes deccanensis]|uniref:DNA-binding response regulator n=1 Tax=Paractinoplanes deccanensis TaxID=113561 RepID=A0ABQ3YJN9_9ACTN|nr:response regulator transcription factor [Actinoplanes deccanensis]GID80219.1 DNA-binding response regulator [Actinoplanes deccanensis]
MTHDHTEKTAQPYTNGALMLHPTGNGHLVADPSRPATRITVALVDEPGLFREGLAGLLEKQPGIHVVGAADADAVADHALRHHRPDVLLVGLDAADPQALDQLRMLRHAVPEAKLVILAARDDPRRVEHLLASGAHAYILKNTSLDELLTTIRVVDQHEDHVVLSVSRETVDRLRANSEPILSHREAEVLTLVADGMRNSAIAAKLFIAEGTVKRHLTNIYAKLGATSRTDAVRRAAKAGLT